MKVKIMYIAIFLILPVQAIGINRFSFGTYESTISAEENFSVPITIEAENLLAVATDIHFDSNLMTFSGFVEGGLFGSCNTTPIIKEVTPGHLVVGVAGMNDGCPPLNTTDVMVYLVFTAKNISGETDLYFSKDWAIVENGSRMEKEKPVSTRKTLYILASSQELDEIPAVISLVAPSGPLPAGTSSYVLRVRTNEQAECGYSFESTDKYLDTFLMASTDGLNHSLPVLDIQDNQSFDVFVRCLDSARNENETPLRVRFSFSASTVAVLEISSTNIELNYQNTNDVRIETLTSINANCFYAVNRLVGYESMKVFDYTSSTSHIHDIKQAELVHGDNKIYVQCSTGEQVSRKESYNLYYRPAEVSQSTTPAQTTVSSGGGGGGGGGCFLQSILE